MSYSTQKHWKHRPLGHCLFGLGTFTKIQLADALNCCIQNNTITQMSSESFSSVNKSFCLHVSSCGSTTTSKWQTLNEALDLILDRSPGEDENMEPGEGNQGAILHITGVIIQKLSLFQKLAEMFGNHGDRNEMSVINAGNWTFKSRFTHPAHSTVEQK